MTKGQPFLPCSGKLIMKKQTILVVDDDPEMRLALQVRLKANNYDVFTAVDGVSAIA